jgi:uncharacterized membrane protein YeiH
MIGAVGYFGTAVFAVSGALRAVERCFDLFGVLAIALVTAIGGGTVRDLLLGRPVGWIHDSSIVGVALVAGLATFVLAPAKVGERRWLLIADAVGLAAFAVLGARTALEAGAGAAATLMIGTLSGVAGGMARDLLCGSIPLVLHEDVYATAALGGAFVYLLAAEGDARSGTAVVLGGLVALGIRLCAIGFGLHLPRVRRAPQPSGDSELNGQQ